MGHGLAYSLGEVFALHDVGDFLGVLVNPLLYGVGNAGDVGCLVDIGRHEIAQLAELLDHWRNDEPDDARHNGRDEDERDNDAEGARRHMQPVLHELHDGVEQVGYEPRHEERKQHRA